jgi:hypothetical protein
MAVVMNNYYTVLHYIAILSYYSIVIDSDIKTKKFKYKNTRPILQKKTITEEHYTFVE